MNRIIKRMFSMLVVITMFVSLSFVSNAQGTTSISVTNSTIGVGESTTVTVNASATGSVTIKYTASLMSLSSCSAPGYSSDGNTVTFKGTSADLVFSGVEEGTASIIVSSSSCSGSSTTIAISNGGSSEEAASGEPVVEEFAAEVESEVAVSTGVGTLADDGSFNIDGVSYVVSERYSDAEIPAGFSKVTLTIGGGTYNELANDSFTIIYLKPADNTEGSGEFYIYKAEAGTVVKFQILGTKDYYVVLSSDAEAPSSAMHQTAFDTEKGSFVGYAIEGSEFKYVYGEDNKGYTGWFIYDGEYQTVSRADTAVFSMTSVSFDDEELDDEEEESSYDSSAVFKDKIKKLRRVISVLAVLCVVMAFVIINYIVRNRATDDDEDVSDDIFSKTSNTASRLPRSIVFADPLAEDDEEDDNNSTSPEKDRNSGLDMMDLNDL